MALGSIVEATVASRDVAAGVAFARRVFGWELVEDGPAGVVLGVPEVPVGRVRFVPAASDPGYPFPLLWERGPRLLGVYSTDLDRTGELVEAAGGTTGTVGVFDIGRDEPLRERLVYAPDDVIYTVPDYEPRLPTPAIAADPDRPHGELHSAVIVVEDVDEALAVFAGAGGLDVVYDGPFGGELAEEMLGLPPGGNLRNAVLGGDALAPARLELLSFHDVPPTDQRVRPVGLQRITFAVDSVEDEAAALARAGAEPQGAGLLVGPAGIEIELRRRAV